jgi:superfamily I DNA/RNA helicase
MDKKIILAVAGSGKTTYLVNQIPKEGRSLIITYTNSNILNLRRNIINTFGEFPNHIRLATYYSFLYSFCIQPFLMQKYKLRGLTYKLNAPMYAKTDENKRYLTKNNRLYHNRAAKFIEIKGSCDDIKKRLEKYYRYFYIDEIQDFAGHDFELLEKISESNINILYVGDFYQHTFDTSRDGNVKQSLHNDYNKYKEKFRGMGFVVDEMTLNKSYRCSQQICNFIKNNLNINIESYKTDISEIKYIDNKMEIKKIMEDDNIIKLFRQKHYSYKCKSRNWGDCKGENQYNNICVVLNPKTLKYYMENKLHKLENGTLNKLYVAISRAHRNVYFISEEEIKDYKKIIYHPHKKFS